MDELTSLLLTNEETKVIQEALEAWITAAERDAALGGLIMSALMSRGVEGEAQEGKELREGLAVAGEKQAADRKRKAYAILAKL